MKRGELLGKMSEIFCDILDEDTLEITEETSQENLEDWDSLTHVTLFAVLEDEFSLHFSVEEMEKGTSVAKLLDYLEAKL